jgi:hypothetical protein
VRQRNTSMRALVVVALLSSLAHADLEVPQASATFHRFVRDLAARRSQHVVASWTVNLDPEPDLEHVAVLYDDDSRSFGSGGDFIIEKGGRQRWDVRFYADGRTLPSERGEIARHRGASPLYRGAHDRHPQTILYELGWHHGYKDTLLALRDGRVAVVFEEGIEDATVSEKPSATDWDALVRSKQARYRFIEPGEIDENEAKDRTLVLRSID